MVERIGKNLEREVEVERILVLDVVSNKGYLSPRDLFDAFLNDSYKTTCCHGNGTCHSCYSNCDMPG